MPENRFPSCSSGFGGKELVCIETNRILDSCRDRDCFENVKVLLTDIGCEIIERTNSIRVKDSEICNAYIGITPVRFNCGFYSVNIKFYLKLTFEACLGGRAQEFDGIAVIEKNVVLFGGENNVSTFKSLDGGSYCALPEPCTCTKNVPTAVVDVVEPIILGVKVMEPHTDCGCICCCCACDLPDKVVGGLNGIPNDYDDNGKYLVISIGLFSVVRIIRPGQYLLNATEYSVPEKECVSPEMDDPCSVFNTMPFPVSEFSTQGHVPVSRPAMDKGGSGKCGCSNN